MINNCLRPTDLLEVMILGNTGETTQGQRSIQYDIVKFHSLEQVAVMNGQVENMMSSSFNGSLKF